LPSPPDGGTKTEESFDEPPVYRWTGKAPAATPRPEVEDDAPRGGSLFSRLSLSFR
jgi:hypothetical protein